MKIVKHIPNTITSLNLVCGVLGIVSAFNGRVDISFLLMLAAAVFDFCDGLAARLCKAYSDMGKELDSLCDMVSFGVLPSVMLYLTMRTCRFGESWLCYVPLVIAVASALRLAKFNVDERQHDSFIGLPTPACAIFVGAICYYIAHDPASLLAIWASGDVLVPVSSLILSYLLVSEIPMFSFKFGTGANADSALVIKRWALIICAAISIAIVVICSLNWSLALVLLFASYILMNVLFVIK